jgi:hypothetical protein
MITDGFEIRSRGVEDDAGGFRRERSKMKKFAVGDSILS